MASHQRRERLVFSGQRSVNQLFVAQFGGHVISRTPCRGET
jgi:hypothetical protein